VHKNWFLFISGLFTIFLTVISLKESDNIPDVEIPYLDKVFHFLAYIVLTVLWSKYASLKSANTKANGILIIVALFIAIYGIIIEVLQIELTTTRMLEISDIVANLLGIAFGILIYKYSIKHKLNSNKGLFF